MSQTLYYFRKEEIQYPQKLLHLSDAPPGIYCKGSLPDMQKPTVAIVGARMCSDYGRKMAYSYAKELSQNGVQIISGLAKGIDGHAHRGALAGETPTFAVLGCGLDYCYPAEHVGLMEEILNTGGGVLSEYPICTPPLRHHFPKRNRIISALSDLVLIIEAKEKSGSLITADCALEQGKTVYALPGRVDDKLSFGCNHLIAQGAGIACSVECILEELHIDRKKGEDKVKKISLASDLNLVYSCLSLSPKGLDQLSEETGLPIGRLSELLLQLELDAYIEQSGRNQFIRA